MNFIMAQRHLGSFCWSLHQSGSGFQISSMIKTPSTCRRRQSRGRAEAEQRRSRDVCGEAVCRGNRPWFKTSELNEFTTRPPAHPVPAASSSLSEPHASRAAASSKGSANRLTHSQVLPSICKERSWPSCCKVKFSQKGQNSLYELLQKT